METSLYNAQNKALHKGFTALGMPYNDNKEFWLPLLIRAAGGRKVEGLSGLTLGERWQLIRSMIKQGVSLHNPGLSREVWYWKKGDPIIKFPEPTAPTAKKRPLNVPQEKRAMVKKIGAILAKRKLSWAYADGIAQKRFQVQVVEWLTTEDLEKVMQMLIKYDRRHKGKD